MRSSGDPFDTEEFVVEPDESSTASPFRTLDRLAARAPEIRGVSKEDVRSGDWLVIRTRNSTYTLAALDDGRYAAAGGWFARQEAAGETAVTVTGCTWGGRAILTSMVAAPGMFLEFDNGVRTTRISEVRHIRGGNSKPH